MSTHIYLVKIIKARFGTGAHILFTFFGLLCNLIVCGSLLRKWRFTYSSVYRLRNIYPAVGGAATVTAITGMPVEAACFLLPIGIAVYVVVGGLRATFICDWAHTVILFIVIYIFIFKT